jgi:hypothetical protein
MFILVWYKDANLFLHSTWHKNKTKTWFRTNDSYTFSMHPKICIFHSFIFFFLIFDAFSFVFLSSLSKSTVQSTLNWTNFPKVSSCIMLLQQRTKKKAKFLLVFAFKSEGHSLSSCYHTASHTYRNKCKMFVLQKPGKKQGKSNFVTQRATPWSEIALLNWIGMQLRTLRVPSSEFRVPSSNLWCDFEEWNRFTSTLLAVIRRGFPLIFVSVTGQLNIKQK